MPAPLLQRVGGWRELQHNGAQMLIQSHDGDDGAQVAVGRALHLHRLGLKILGRIQRRKDSCQILAVTGHNHLVVRRGEHRRLKALYPHQLSKVLVHLIQVGRHQLAANRPGERCAEAGQRHFGTVPVQLLPDSNPTGGRQQYEAVISGGGTRAACAGDCATPR